MKRTFAPLLLAAVLGLPLPAGANNLADEADVAFELGNDHYARGRYIEALREYFQSYRLVPNRNVLFNIARCYEALDRFDEAYRYYYDLSEEELDDRDRADVTRALSRIRPRVALVSVQTEPPGAEVYVDRVDLGSRGRTPQVLADRPGQHQVIVRLEGYHEMRVDVSLSRGRQAAEKIALIPILGKVKVTGVPEGAELRVDPEGPVLGRVPSTIELPIGQRVLHVSAPGHARQQLVVTVDEAKTQALTVTLGRQIGPAGKLIVTTNRENARIRVDGVESGFAPAVLTVAEGEHEVELSLPEMRTVTRTVTVARDDDTPLHVNLSFAPPPVRAASKSLMSSEEAPASISVITSEEIRAFGYQTLTEALDGIRGVFLADDRVYTFMGIRGIAPPGDLNTRVLILWDGHALNDVWAGQGYAARDLAVDLEDVDRIEVVRGPGSALYGTSALFAVINVVPRDGLRQGQVVEVTGGSGGLGSFRGHATVSGQLPFGAQAMLSASAYRASGSEVTDLGDAGLVSGLDGERAYNAHLRMRWGGFTLSGIFNHREKDIPTAPFNVAIGVPGTSAFDSRGFAELRYDTELGFGSVSARAWYDGSRYTGTYVYPGANPGEFAPSTDYGHADWIGLEARSRIHLFGQNHLTAGFEGQQQLRIDHGGFGVALPSLRRTVLSGYLLDEWALHPQLFVSLGLRIDKYLSESVADQEMLPITPRAAVVFRPYEAGVSKLVAGTAFRAPNAYELLNEDFGVSSTRPDSLAPETITTVELEHSHLVTPELRLTGSVYWNRLHSLIVLAEQNLPVPTCGTPAEPIQCLQYQNLDQPLQALGAEAELRWQAGRYALLDLSYSFVSLTGLTPQVTATPAHLVMGKLLLPLGETGARVAVRAKYQSARGLEGQSPIGEALLLDFGISGEGSHFRYFAGVSNLLDSRFRLPLGPDYIGPVPQLGRQFQVQISASY